MAKDILNYDIYITLFRSNINYAVYFLLLLLTSSCLYSVQKNLRREVTRLTNIVYFCCSLYKEERKLLTFHIEINPCDTLKPNLKILVSFKTGL